MPPGRGFCALPDAGPLNSKLHHSPVPALRHPGESRWPDQQSLWILKLFHILEAFENVNNFIENFPFLRFLSLFHFLTTPPQC